MIDVIFTNLQDSEAGFNLIFICAFGIPLFILVLWGFTKLINIIGLKIVSQFLINTFYLAFIVVWIGGFIISILCYFNKISPIKTFLILLGLFIITTVFQVLNRKKVDDFFDYIKMKNFEKIKS